MLLTVLCEVSDSIMGQNKFHVFLQHNLWMISYLNSLSVGAWKQIMCLSECMCFRDKMVAISNPSQFHLLCQTSVTGKLILWSWISQHRLLLERYAMIHDLTFLALSHKRHQSHQWDLFLFLTKSGNQDQWLDQSGKQDQWLDPYITQMALNF